MTSIAYTGQKWAKSTVTYYISPSITNYRDEIIQAFETWDIYIALDFTQTASSFGADIYIGEAFIDGDGGTLAEAGWSYNFLDQITFADIYFDTAENYDLTVTWNQEAFKVALHEIGHVFGLDHPSDPNVIMNAYIPTSINNLTVHDIAGGQALYGAEATYVLGWVYEYDYGWEYGWTTQWVQGWEVGWYDGWGYVQNSAWTYVENWGWTVGWGYGWEVGAWGWEQVYNYGWHLELIGSWELQTGWVLQDGWHYGWHYGWIQESVQGWHLDWGWHWSQGWVLA